MTRHAANNALAISVKLTCNLLLNHCQQCTEIIQNPACAVVFLRRSVVCLCIHLLQLSFGCVEFSLFIKHNADSEQRCIYSNRRLL